MRALVLMSALVIVLAACGMPATTGNGTPAPATGETAALPSATPLPTGEPATPSGC
jgi:ABC-type glycerol-3-phosphate transport system substrate-binding protein